VDGIATKTGVYIKRLSLEWCVSKELVQVVKTADRHKLLL